MNPYQLHLNPYTGPKLLIVMTFLGLAAEMTHYFCKQLALFLIVCKRFYLEALTLTQWSAVELLPSYNVGQWQAWMVTMLSMDQLWNWQTVFPGYLIWYNCSITEFI